MEFNPVLKALCIQSPSDADKKQTVLVINKQGRVIHYERCDQHKTDNINAHLKTLLPKPYNYIL